MTQERLRELLRERVADETMPDHSGRAWQAAGVVRRRRRLGAAAGVVAAILAVSAGIAVVDSAPPAGPPSDHGVPALSESPDTPDATYEGVPVWWSPDQQEERRLPAVDSPLPAEIDLSGRPDDDMGRALAVFDHQRSATLVGPGGELRWVDLSGLEEVGKPNGYSSFPSPTLTGDGSQLVFPRPEGGFAVYTIATRTWSRGLTVAGPGLVPPDPGFDTGSAQQYGAPSGGAASWGMGVPLPVRDPASEYSDPEFLVAHGSVLVFSWTVDDGQDSRYQQCCPVAGWLDGRTVVYESRQSQPLLVAWRVGSHDFGLVSRIHGAYDVAAFALGAP
jgi:hypothetical protein